MEHKKDSPGKDREKKGFALLLQWAGRDRYYIYASVAAASLASLLTVLPYLAFYRIIEIVSSGLDEHADPKIILDHVSLWALIVFVSAAGKALLSMASTLLSHRGAYNILFKVRCMVTEHMARMPLGALDERSTGEIKYMMNESIEKMELFLAHNLPELVLYLTGPVIMFIYLLTVHPGLALLSILPLVFVVIIIALMYMRFSRYMGDVNETGANLSSAISEYVMGMRLVKALNISSQSFQKLKDAVQRQHKVWGQISMATGPLYAAYVVILECGILFLVPVGGYLYVHGHVTVGVLLLFAFVGSQYLTDIRPLQELANNLSFAGNGVDQVADLLDEPVFEEGLPFPEKCDIEIDHISFSYDGEHTVLNDVSLTIDEGEKIAFVGRSGAGKTTLARLISRFYDVDAGAIRIGGVDVREIDYEQLLQNISIVFQQSFLSRGTIYENIAMGMETDIEAVRQAARLARIDDFIMGLPEGYDTQVGSYGGRFSGGQKQRICIARAILKDAPVLILDEATSAADPENQREIDEAIHHLCQDKTVIFIAHRLEVLDTCSRVAVIDHAGLSGIGQVEEMKRSDDYLKQAWESYMESGKIIYGHRGEA